MSAPKATKKTAGEQHAMKDGALAGIPDCCRRAEEAMRDAERRAIEFGRADLAAEARSILSTIRELWKDADKIIRPAAQPAKKLAPDEEPSLL